MLTILTTLLLAPAPVQESPRPNVLLIVADDQSPFDLRVYDPNSRLEAPTLEALAAAGMTLDAAYHMGSWSGAVCTPSRHMIMSGRTVWHLPKNGIRNVQQNPLCPEDLADSTLGAIFGAAGYDTMRTCKKGNSYPAANERFQIVHEEVRRDPEGNEWHADRVLEFLDERERTNDEDPFFVYFGFSHPHDPRHGRPELLEKYGAVDEYEGGDVGEGAPGLPTNYLERHPFHHGHPGLRDEVNVQGVKKRRDAGTIRNELGRQFACSEDIDTQIGRVLERLRETGELENTYVIYTADHGMAIGRHGLQGKQNLYEHTWRVPLIVQGPGIEAGSRAPGNVYLLDILATVCDLTGVAAPETNEGTSFAPVLRGEKTTVRDVLFGVYAGGTKPGMRSVRKGEWKLVEFDVLDGFVRETQLFHLGENPLELIAEHGRSGRGGMRLDLAEDPRYAEKVEEMRALLTAEMERLDDPYTLWFQE